MRLTPSKALTSSTIAKIENVMNEVLDGRRAPLSQRQERVLAKAVLFLLKENRRLTSSNAQFQQSLRELELTRHKQLKEILKLQLRLHKQAVLGQSSPWDKTSLGTPATLQSE